MKSKNVYMTEWEFCMAPNVTPWHCSHLRLLCIRDNFWVTLAPCQNQMLFSMSWIHRMLINCTCDFTMSGVSQMLMNCMCASCCNTTWEMHWVLSTDTKHSEYKPNGNNHEHVHHVYSMHDKLLVLFLYFPLKLYILCTNDQNKC